MKTKNLFDIISKIKKNKLKNKKRKKYIKKKKE